MAEVSDFSVQVNLTGAGPVDVMQQDPPGGPYEVEILDARQVTSEKEGGKTTLRFNVAIVGGPSNGLSTGLVIGTDWTKPFNVGHLVNLLHGLHDANGRFVDPKKWQGVVDVKAGMFKGARAFIYVKAPPEGEINEETGKPARANKNFITKAMFDAAVKAQALNLGAPAAPAAAAPAKTNGAAQPAQAAAATTPPPAAQGGSLGELFA